MKNRKQIVIIGGSVVITALLCAGIFFGIKNRMATVKRAAIKRASHQSARPVSIEQARSQHIKREHRYPGVVGASQKSALSFRVGGPLVKLNFVLGQPIAKGTLLMQVDPRDYEDKIRSLEAQLKGAQAILLNSNQDYKRASDLHKEKVIPQSNYDRAEGLKKAALAAVDTLQAQLQIERHSLEDTSLLAPYDGRVAAQFSENHEMINPGQVVVQFHNIQKLEIVVNIPENEIIQYGINSDKIAQISFPAIPAKKYKADLKEWSSVADPVTRTYAATYEFDAPSDINVLPGMSAEVVLTSISAKAVLTLPAAALAYDATGHSTLWIYDQHNSNATQRIVETGAFIGIDRIVILSGITEEEQIVVNGSRLINKHLQLKPVSDTL